MCVTPKDQSCPVRRFGQDLPNSLPLFSQKLKITPVTIPVILPTKLEEEPWFPPPWTPKISRNGLRPVLPFPLPTSDFRQPSVCSFYLNLINNV